MRSIYLTSFAAFSISAAFVAAAAAEEPATKFPYSAFVAVDEAPVRGGAGETFYPVLNLKRGDAVEVWNQTDDGWYAIRPPLGSFCWIAADFVETTDGRLGTVVGEQVNVRIGTQFSALRDAIQLQLHAGDQVEILAERMLQTGDRETRWFKILPPAGEFRWIARRHVVDHPSQIPSAKPSPAGDVQAAAFEEPATAVRDDRIRLVSLADDATTGDVLFELDAALSRMVAAEPTAWNFEELEGHGNALVDRAETAVERSQARLFLGKIARFKDIQKRYRSMAEIRSQTTVVDRQLDQSAPIVIPKTALDGTADTSRYDGVGRLSQIVLQQSGGPSYALTNETGEMQVYVVAAPGVNLRQYVGLEVGINGIRGIGNDQRLPQLTAKRIDVLSRRSK
jgi:hypothetical protein